MCSVQCYHPVRLKASAVLCTAPGERQRTDGLDLQRGEAVHGQRLARRAQQRQHRGRLQRHDPEQLRNQLQRGVKAPRQHIRDRRRPA